jgi:hypothetical protein
LGAGGEDLVREFVKKADASWRHSSGEDRRSPMNREARRALAYLIGGRTSLLVPENGLVL